MKRIEIVKILKMIEEYGEGIVPSNIDSYYDEMGKNALIVALENKLYKAFTILVNPIRYGDGYKILFDPFSKNIELGKKPLVWPYVTIVNGLPLKDYTGIANTKDDYYSIYSAYNYIVHMTDDIARHKLINVCMNIDHSYDSYITLNDVPLKDISYDFKLYNEDDVIKYSHHAMVSFITDLFLKNIPIVKYRMKKTNGFYEMYLLLDSNLLSDDNKSNLEEIQKYFSISHEYNYVRLTYKFNSFKSCNQVNDYLLFTGQFFKKQDLKMGIVSIDETYKSIEYLLSIYGIKLDKNLSKDEMIQVCMRANKYLALKDDNNFYKHYDLIKRDIIDVTLKKES